MPKRRKKKDGWESFDNYDDFMDSLAQRSASQVSSSEADAEPEVQKISLDDFTVKQKIAAFVHTYEPCTEFDPGAERFDDARLREYFKAYVTGLGDPLHLYVDALAIQGDFEMVTSLATDKPAIFARYRI